jgi:hypothetical protein
MRYLIRVLLCAWGDTLAQALSSAAGEGRRLVLIVHHDDAEGEFAYEHQSHIGNLDKAWDEAKARNRIVVSMKSDWNNIFAFEK